MRVTTINEISISATTATNASYTLPDGRVIKFGPERFMGPECLFQPDLIDVEGDGISELVFKCIQENEIDNRRSLYQHIVLSGGNSMYAGFSIASRARHQALTSQECVERRQGGDEKVQDEGRGAKASQTHGLSEAPSWPTSCEVKTSSGSPSKSSKSKA